MDARMDGWMHGWMGWDGIGSDWINGWMDGQMDRWNGWSDACVCMLMAMSITPLIFSVYS